MRCVRYARVNDREIPVVISDEREALLAAKAAGRAIIGVWRKNPGNREGKTVTMESDPYDVSAAPYAVFSADVIDARLLERVARRHLGLPWRICETRRLFIREMAWDDFDEIWEQPVGRGFGTPEALEAYVKNQYAFYEYGFWALIGKADGALVGLAGFAAPGEIQEEPAEERRAGENRADENRNERDGTRILYRGNPSAEMMELGYYIVPVCRRQGYARESCLAVMKYAGDEWGIRDFFVRIRQENTASLALAAELGFREAQAPVIKKEFQ